MRACTNLWAILKHYGGFVAFIELFRFLYCLRFQQLLIYNVCLLRLSNERGKPYICIEIHK